MKTVFMGTPDFAAESLKAIIDAGHHVCLVMSQPDAARDRGKKFKPTPVKMVAMENDIPVYQPESIKDEECINRLAELNPDIIVVAAYGKILPKEILTLPKYGCINVHASLLPKYRGSAPIQYAILNGEEETGVTIMQMAEGMDTGDMLSKATVTVGRANCEELHDKLASCGGQLLVETMKAIEDGTVCPEKQDDSKATMAPMISKKDGLVDFSMDAESIERKVRAFYPWPGAYTNYKDQLLKIWEADAISWNGEEKPGSILAADAEGIKVGCGKGALLLKTIQVPGKKRMSVSDYLKGNTIEIGTILG